MSAAVDPRAATAGPEGGEAPRRGPSLGRRMWKTLWQQPLYAIPFALFFGTIYGGNVSTYFMAYRFSLIFAYTIRITLELLEHFVLPRFRTPGPQGRVPLRVEIGLYAATSLGASYLAAAIIHFTLLPGMLGSARSVLINGAFALVFSLLFGGIAYAVHFYRESMARARAVEAMRVELAQAELRALRAQLQPHFLFNTLNSIAALIPMNPRGAEEMTTRLAEVFRYALRASDRESAPLGEELDFLRAYLDIERARFGDRLRVEERIEPGLEVVPVPTLLLQPVVENAVRHGVAARPGGGRVILDARRRGDRLVLSVEDDGPGFDPSVAGSPSGNGFGLHSVRERLRAAGHPPDALVIDSAPGRGTRVVVQLAATPSPTPS
jgi:two-component system LytT family sensor kinase